jgi:DNA-binding LacI/PurR family transcriptional regulator
MTPARARHVALLLDRIDEPYQSELFGALRAAALQRGLSLLGFLGGPPRPSEESGDPRGRIFELAPRGDLAGAVIAAANLNSRPARSTLSRLSALLAPAPTVSLGAMLEGLPAVLLDNHDAMRQLVEHLIVTHGKRRIAFVRGPLGNEEAEDRYRGYLRALFEHDIAPDESLVVPGDRDRASGAAAAALLLGRGGSFDALVATTDRAASGALDALRDHGCDVPGTIAVVGCDDSAEARAGLCPLTTMRQPISELAEVTLDALLQNEQSATRILPAELVVRRSCGCQGELGVRASLPPARGDQELPLLRRRAELVAAMRQAASCTAEGRWADELFTSFVGDVRGKTHAAFAAQTERLLDFVLRDGGDPAQVQRVVDVLRSGALPALTELPGMMLRAEAALYAAGVAIASALRDGGQHQGQSFYDTSQVLLAIAHELVLRAGIDQIGSSLERYLPRLGVDSGGLATLHPEHGLTQLDWCWTWGNPRAFWWTTGARATAGAAPSASIVMPLTFEDELLGVASFEVGTLHGVVLEMLRALLSSALAHALRC